MRMSLFKKAIKLLKENRVIKEGETDSAMFFKVVPSKYNPNEELLPEEYYNVIISYENYNFTAKCDCKYQTFKSGSFCSHILATLLKISEDIENEKKIENGYAFVKTEDGWYPEHKLVVEKFIGRKLKPNEVVHHIDENKLNNDISNLMVFQSQKEHAEFHNKTKRGITSNIKRQINERWENLK